MKPKIDESLYQKLRERIQSGAPVEDLLDKYESYDIRNLLEEASAREIGNKDPRDFFEKPEVFSNIPIKENKSLKNYGEFDSMYDAKTKLPDMKSGIITLKDKGDKATLLHELNHAYDAFKDPNKQMFIPSEHSDDYVRKALNLGKKQELRGLEHAVEQYADHFRPEGKLPKLKQLLNFERLVKGNPLRMIAPVAVGAAALGATEKAMAGDLTGATKDIGELGMNMTVPDIMTSDSVNENEDEVLNNYVRGTKTPQTRRFEKIKSIMEGK